MKAAIKRVQKIRWCTEDYEILQRETTKVKHKKNDEGIGLSRMTKNLHVSQIFEKK